MTDTKTPLVGKDFKTIEDIFIDRGLLDRLYTNSVPVDLFRFFESTDLPHSRFLLRPVLEPYAVAPGRMRSIDIERRDINGIMYVIAGTGGVSLFDGVAPFKKPGVHYKLPQGTAIPPGLAISRDNLSKTLGRVHYTLHPSQTMAELHFLFLLRRLSVFARPA